MQCLLYVITFQQ